MSAEENITIARNLFMEQDRHKGALPPELCAPGYTAHIPGFPPMNLAAHTELGKAFYAAFPDLTQTVEDAITDEAKVVLRCTVTGTHQGELMGMPASGKQIRISAIAIFQIVEGKVAELHEIFDQMGMMQQIGAIPSS